MRRLDMPKDNRFLNISDYTLKPYSSSGFSGLIYMAEPNKKGLPPLLIKHKEVNSACNEFVACRIGNLLRVPVPQAYFMKAEKEDSRFVSPYVVGIEYVDGLTGATDDELKSNSFLRFGYIQNHALQIMFSQSDRIQLSKTPQGEIIGYDFTDCFKVTEYTVNVLLGNTDAGVAALSRALNAFVNMGIASASDDCVKYLAAKLGEKTTEDVQITFDEPMNLLLSLSRGSIQPIYDAVEEVYSLELSVYYEEYISELRNMIASYIPSAEHYRSIEEVDAVLSENYRDKTAENAAAVKKEFGTRGLKEFRDLMDSERASFRRPRAGLEDMEAYLLSLQDAFLIAKRKARVKFTPNKYRVTGDKEA